MAIDEILNPYIWLFFWIVVFPMSIYRLCKEIKKENRNLHCMIETLMVLIISIAFILITF